MPIDIHKDLIYKSDTDRYSVSIDTALHVKGWILIGASDTLSTEVYEEYDFSYNLRIGDAVEIYQQGFRDCSPFVNLLVSGEVTDNGWYTEIKKYQLTVGCFFTEYAYYKRYREEKYTSFTQDINKLILPVLTKKEIKYSYIFLKAYIDRDEYYDLLLQVNGVFYFIAE